jgi:hypothetical protein
LFRLFPLHPSPGLGRLQPFDYSLTVWSIRPLPEFTAWLNDLADASVRGVVVARIKRRKHEKAHQGGRPT